MHKTSSSRGFIHKQKGNNLVKTIARVGGKGACVKPVCKSSISAPQFELLFKR